MLTIMLNEGDDIENKLKFNQAKSQQNLLKSNSNDCKSKVVKNGFNQVQNTKVSRTSFLRIKTIKIISIFPW